MHRLLACVIALTASTACAQNSPGDSNEVVARFADKTISAAELADNEDLRLQLVAIEQQQYDVKRQFLEQMIFERLIEEAARQDGLSVDEYLQKNVADQVPEPDESQVNGVLSQYRSRLNPDPAKAREQVVEALKQQSQQQLQADLQKRLFREAEVAILIEPPRFEAQIADYHPERGGGRKAPVTLVEYTDFQCPFCTRVQPTLDEIVERYGDNVRHVFKQLPLAMHAQAQLAAEASLCAADQGKFWEFHDWLFANSRRINRDTLSEQARELSLDEVGFASCLDEKVHTLRVQQDMQEAQQFGISGTPGFLVNGRVLRGAQPIERFIQVIDEELRRAGVEPPEKPAAGEPTADPAPAS
jgi:protein-disulfide isomerase